VKWKDVRISPYTLIPVIFSGIPLLAVIAIYRIDVSTLKKLQNFRTRI